MSKHKKLTPAEAGFVEPMEADLEEDAPTEGDVTESPKNTADRPRLTGDTFPIEEGGPVRTGTFTRTRNEDGTVTDDLRMDPLDGPAGLDRAFGDPLPYRVPVPRGPFVRYHDVNERSFHAVVTAVHEDGSISCHIFPDGPRTQHMVKVPHGYDAGCWEDYV